MSCLVWLRAMICCSFLLLCSSPLWAQSPALDAPESAPSGSAVAVKCTGTTQFSDRIAVAAAGSPDDPQPQQHYAFWYGKNVVKVRTPEAPGEYELRYISVKTRSVLARRKLTITPVTATLEAPETVAGGQTVRVSFDGPRATLDRIAIVPVATPEGTVPKQYFAFTYTKQRVDVKAPEQPGEYELRYLRGQSHTTLARRKLVIAGATASLKAPRSAVAGARIPIGIQGPHGQFDKIAVVPAGTADDVKIERHYAFVYNHDKLGFGLPEQAGEYELRYVTGASGTILAREPLTIQAAGASLEAPVQVPAGSRFEVRWQGPGNQFDQIVVAPKGAPEDRWSKFGYVHGHNPMRLTAPVTLGPYELRYQTGASGTTLARADLEVVPAQQEPGLLQVTTGQRSPAAGGAGGAVEIILDASGSMLQKIGSERRIDIAKQTLKHLTSEVIPAGTPFALRVFGREADSCQSDLDIPLKPLDAASVAARVAALEAKSNARTPIGASLEKVAADLKAVKGERLVVLVTDGEETCGGDPRRAIEALRKGGVNVRVNIVGFAVDDRKLAATFRQWSVAGNGAYFDARDAAGLKQALSSAIRPAFEVLDQKQLIVADGVAGDEPVMLLPGTYTVRRKGQTGRSQSVRVKAKQTTTIQL